MQIDLVTPQMLDEAVEALSHQLKEIKDSVADATRPPIYGELKTVTKFVTTVGCLSENVLAKLENFVTNLSQFLL